MEVDKKLIDQYRKEWEESTKKLDEMFNRTDAILAEFGIIRNRLKSHKKS